MSTYLNINKVYFKHTLTQPILVNVGQAIWTSAGGLTSDFVIHAVAPVFTVGD